MRRSKGSNAVSLQLPWPTTAARSISGNTGYAAFNNTRQYRQEHGRYSPALRVRGVLLHVNVCGEKTIIMNRQVLCSWFNEPPSTLQLVPISRVVTVFASR